MTLADEQYMAFTTFKKDGTPKPRPVWPADAGDGRVGFITSSQTWKVKRLANNNRVELQPSDFRGRPKEGTLSQSGTAVVVRGSEFEAVHTAVRDKYRFKVKLINGVHALQRLMRRGGHPNDCAVIITLDEA
jgi:uncharacterized protein